MCHFTLGSKNLEFYDFEIKEQLYKFSKIITQNFLLMVLLIINGRQLNFIILKLNSNSHFLLISVT